MSKKNKKLRAEKFRVVDYWQDFILDDSQDYFLEYDYLGNRIYEDYDWFDDWWFSDY